MVRIPDTLEEFYTMKEHLEPPTVPKELKEFAIRTGMPALLVNELDKMLVSSYQAGYAACLIEHIRATSLALKGLVDETN